MLDMGVRMMFTDCLLILVFVMLVFISVQNMVLYSKSVRREAELAQERAVDRAMEERAKEAAANHDEETRASRAVDEGIENIMTFQVRKGRGSTTGGEL